MKIAIILSRIAFTISLPLVLLLSTLSFVFSDIEFYSNSFERNNIAEATNFSESELKYISEQLVEYLRGDRENIEIYLEKDGIQTEVFGDREKLHMEDVKDLFDKGYFIRDIALILTLISLTSLICLNRNKIGISFIMTSATALTAIVVGGILISLNFDRAFTSFHLVFFDNDLWLLDPREDVLIQMLPIDFFYRITLKIGSLFLVELLGLLTAGLVLLKKFNLHCEK